MAPYLTTWHPAMAPYHGTLSSNGTLPWHLTTWHLAMAPSNGSFCSSRQLAHPPPHMAPSNGTQRRQLLNGSLPYHMAPSNGTLPWHPIQWHPAITQQRQLLNGTLPLPHDTQQWHITMAPSPMAPYHMAPSNGNFCSSRQLAHPPPHMAPSNGTQQRQLLFKPPTCTPTPPHGT